MNLLYVCLAFSCATFVYSQSQACFNAMNCQTAEFKKATYDNDKETLCRIGPSIVECVVRVNKDCDNERMFSKNLRQATLFNETLQKCASILSTTPTYVDPVKCAEAYSKCKASELEKLIERGDKKEVCSKGPTTIDCLMDANKGCSDTILVSKIRIQMDVFQKTLIQCVNTGLTDGQVTIPPCTKSFIACYPTALDDAKEQNDYKRLCVLFPVAVTCMENALSKCNKPEDKLQVEGLTRELEKLKSKFPSSSYIADVVCCKAMDLLSRLKLCLKAS